MKYLTFVLLFIAAFASQILGQSILKDGKIPDDLVITIGLTANMQFGGYHRYKITSDGKVFYEELDRSLPKSRSLIELLSLQAGKERNKPSKPPKPPKLKDRLSKKQLNKIIAEIEKSAFLELTAEQQCEPNYNHYTTRGISITVNGETKGIEEIKLRCDNNENPRLKNFAILYDFISKEISGVKKNKLTKE